MPRYSVLLKSNNCEVRKPIDADNQAKADEIGRDLAQKEEMKFVRATYIDPHTFGDREPFSGGDIRDF